MMKSLPAKTNVFRHIPKSYSNWMLLLFKVYAYKCAHKQKIITNVYYSWHWHKKTTTLFHTCTASLSCELLSFDMRYVLTG